MLGGMPPRKYRGWRHTVIMSKSLCCCLKVRYDRIEECCHTDREEHGRYGDCEHRAIPREDDRRSDQWASKAYCNYAGFPLLFQVGTFLICLCGNNHGHRVLTVSKGLQYESLRVEFYDPRLPNFSCGDAPVANVIIQDSGVITRKAQSSSVM